MKVTSANTLLASGRGPRSRVTDPLWWRGGAELVLHCKILGFQEIRSTGSKKGLEVWI